MTMSLLFSMMFTGYAFARELTTKSLHSFSSLSWDMHPHTYLSVALHIFLLGSGSDQEPGAPSSNHLPVVRHWVALLLAQRSGIDSPSITNTDFNPPSNPSSSEKASLYISGLEVLLNICHSNQTLFRCRYRYRL